MERAILLYGHAFIGNLGDDLILFAVDRELKTRNIRCSYIIESDVKTYFHFKEYDEAPVPFFKKYRNKFIKLKNIIAYMHEDESRAYKALILYGGGYTNEYFGIRNLRYIYLYVLKARRSGLKIFFTGQTVGPYSSIKCKKLIKSIYGKADAVYVREKNSYNLLKKLQIDSHLTADDAFLLYPLVNEESSRNRVIMNIKVFKGSDAYKDVFFELYLRAASVYKEKYTITVIPFRAEESYSEYIINEELFNFLISNGINAEFVVEREVNKLLDIYSDAKYVIASAYHAIVLGKLCGARVFSTYFDEYYRMKIQGVLELYNEQENCLSIDDFINLKEEDFEACEYEEFNPKNDVTQALYNKVKAEWDYITQ